MVSSWWRVRAVASVLPVAVSLGVLAAVLPGPAHPTGVARVPGATRTDCLDLTEVATVPQLDRFVRSVRGNPAFAGGDVGASAALQDGRIMFVFGDTLRGDDFAGPAFVRNSMLVVSRECAEVVLPPDDGAVIPTRADGVGYWPMSVAVASRPGYDLVAVTAQRVRSNGDEAAGVFAFDILGPAIAVFVVAEGRTPQLVTVHDLGPDRADPTSPMWGAATAAHSGYLYLYGTARPADAADGGFSLRVARVLPEDVLDTGAWSYWDGHRWSAGAGDAVELIGADGGVSQTLSVFESGHTWYAVSKQDEVLGTHLAIWTARRPQGPFTLAATPVEIPSDAATGVLRYLPLAHPELLPRDGTVVVSYSENNTDVDVVADDPRRYRPRFIRVALPR